MATLMAACNNEIPVWVPPTDQVDKWIKLEIPGGQAVYAIAGNIDETLLVTTQTKAYYTIDQGQTWQEARHFGVPVWGLAAQSGLIVALEGQTYDQNFNTYATGPARYYTRDYGRSWQSFIELFGTRDPGIVMPLEIWITNDGILYQIQSNKNFISPSSFTESASQIYRLEGDEFKLLDFPFVHILRSLYMDANKRLYVAAYGGIYDQFSGRLLYNGPESSAVLYISKNPLP
ncbi:MAG: hypothetical protein HC880_03200 [Bacteroidia bacterium]|nr:hypothetical protein [Bacteroidia bacterium]